MGFSILIIDDDQETLDTLSAYLKDTARVFTATGSIGAFELLRQHKMDLILLDVEMPIMDGFLTLEHLRKMEECINVPVILITGRTDKYTIVNSCIMGIDGYLIKPISKETLLDKVSQVFSAKHEKHNKKTVLLIDDDMSYLKQLYSLLHNDYNVVMINSAKLVVNYIMKNIPDVIVMDYQMPLYNGASLMNMIQKTTGGKNIPVIILSGVLDMDALQECYPYSPESYLVKPVSKDILVKNIEKALNK